MNKTFFFISSSDLSRPGAAKFRLLAIARGLCEHGAKVNWILLASKVPDSIANDDKYKSINFISVGKRRGIAVNCKVFAYLYRLLLLANLGPVVRKHVFASDIKAFFSVGDSFVNLMLIYNMCRKKNVFLLHERTEYPYLNAGSLIKKLNLYLYLNIFIPRCDHIFVISTALRDFFSNLPKVRRKSVPVTILNMLVEADRFQLSIGQEALPFKDIVYIGTMYGDKDGVYNLIRAFGLIKNKVPEARLVLVGDNTRQDLMTKINKAMDNIPDKSRIIFTGVLDRTAVIQIINKAYCLALARPDNVQAKYGFPTKLGEYLATGRPVVVTDVGDIPLFLKDEDNAFIAESDSIRSFATKLEECLRDEARAIETGGSGQKLVNEQFDYLKVTKDILWTIEREYAK